MTAQSWSAAADDGAVVCYEADELAAVRRTGWSVIATGRARLVRDSAVVTRYELTGIRLVACCR